MRIGIVTYVKTATCNYGAELQGFALQYKLNKMGYQAEVLDLHRVLPSNGRFWDTVKKVIITRFKKLNLFKACSSIISLFVSVAKDKYYAKKYAAKYADKKKMFHDFFYTQIKHSDKEYYPHELDYVELPYDVYIAGSDQIWNYKNSDRVDVFFLMFANRFKAKKISYAASYSVSTIPDLYLKNYRTWINNIDFLSVREYAGVKLSKNISGRDAALVCDPTLLLDKTEWLTQFDMKDKRIIEDEYVFIYSMSRSNTVFEIARKVAAQLGGVKIVNVKVSFIPTNEDKIEDLFDVTPPQWVRLLADASYVVTDSFHGTAFAVNFNKPFTTLQNPLSELNSRVDTLLTKLNLNNRIFIDNDKGQLPQKLEIDYTQINARLEKWRRDSLLFLTSALDLK